MWAQFKDGKSQSEVTTTLMQKMNYGSHEAILLLEAIRVGYCGIGVPGATKANPRAAVSGMTSIRSSRWPPINSEKRPQADTSLSRPVWPQFCFYPLRIIPQGTQSQGLRMWSVFGGVENSMFLGLC